MLAVFIPVLLLILSAFWTLQTGDPIAVAGLKTNIELQLHHYHFTPDQTLTAWLTQDFSAPVLEEIFVQFSKFAVRHPQEFYKYLKRLNPQDRGRLLPQILGAMTKVQLEEVFAQSFGYPVQELSQKLESEK